MLKPQQRITEEELRALLGPLPGAVEPPLAAGHAQAGPEQIIIPATPAWAEAQLARVCTDLLH